MNDQAFRELLAAEAERVRPGPLLRENRARIRNRRRVSFAAIGILGSVLVASLWMAAGLVRPAGTNPNATGATGQSQGDAATHDAGIYAAVIERLLEENQTDGRSGGRFARVYVLDGVVESAADPMDESDPPSRLPARLKSKIRKLVDYDSPLVFRRERADVLDSLGRVRNQGVLIRLGPIEDRGDVMHVGVNLWVDPMRATWLTYVLSETDGVWTVRDTAGPISTA